MQGTGERRNIQVMCPRCQATFLAEAQAVKVACHNCGYVIRLAGIKRGIKREAAVREKRAL